jgi:hypothetical protein
LQKRIELPSEGLNLEQAFRHGSSIKENGGNFAATIGIDVPTAKIGLRKSSVLDSHPKEAISPPAPGIKWPPPPS